METTGRKVEEKTFSDQEKTGTPYLSYSGRPDVSRPFSSIVSGLTRSRKDSEEGIRAELNEEPGMGLQFVDMSQDTLLEDQEFCSVGNDR